jgi:hypothetical protein
LLAHRISVWIHKIEGNFTYTRLDLTWGSKGIRLWTNPTKKLSNF